MTKIRIAILLLLAFCLGLAHAGMEQTDACNKRIAELKGKIDTHYKLCKAKMDFDQLPLVPEGLRKKKRADIDMKLKELGELACLRTELENEQNRLTSGRIILKKIQITSCGKWDSFTAPEITVKIGDRVIGRGSEDQNSLDLSFTNEDVTRCNMLEVADADLTGDEHMGWIKLRKDNISKGVVGDTDTKKEDGEDTTEQGKISYTVTYEVQY